MTRYTLLLACLLVACGDSKGEAATYEILEPNLRPSGTSFQQRDYAISGTITTDGRTGAFFDTSVIVDYAIQLRTPGDDGVTDELLTPQNSSIGYDGLGSLTVTEEEIFLAAVEPGFLGADLFEIASGAFGGSATQFVLVAPQPEDTFNGFPAIRGEFFVFDDGENPRTHGVRQSDDALGIISLERTLFAVRQVPEPSGTVLLAVVTFLSGLRGRTRNQLGLLV